MNSEFSAALRPFPYGYVLDISGDLTKSSEEVLLHLNPWEQGLGKGGRFLVINFRDVPYINSAGIALLIRIVRAGLKGGYETFAYGLSSHYQKLFRMIGLTEHMMIYPDEYAIMQRIDDLME